MYIYDKTFSSVYTYNLPIFTIIDKHRQANVLILFTLSSLKYIFLTFKVKFDVCMRIYAY